MEKTFQIYCTSDTHGHIFPVNYASNCPENSGLLNLAAQVEKDGNTLVLDGGDAQVHAVLPVLAGMHIDVPVFGMVKDSKHRTRAISTGGGEIQINANRQSFTLVSSIQEEVHRFAVSYHHQKHKKSAFNSTLLQIEGIGPAKAKALLKTLKTVTAVREATQEQLAAVPGISRENAKAVYAYYHGETAAK